ncbi:MAG: hypothetical protein ABUS48_00930 [Pseudomonadota bacterium]
MKPEYRRAVHDALAVPAVLILSGSNTQDVTVRLHGREKDLGPPQDFHGAGRYEGVARAIFWRDDLAAPLARGVIISIAEGEAYNVDSVHPNDGPTVAAEVTRLDAADAEGLPTP